MDRKKKGRFIGPLSAYSACPKSLVLCGQFKHQVHVPWRRQLLEAAKRGILMGQADP